MELSIIIPVYNGEKTIEKCIKSVYETTEDFSFEVIVIDDGSTDNSRKILEKLKEDYNTLCVYHQKNQGVSVARNKGLEIAKGKWIVFLDADDYFEKNWGNTLKKQFENKLSIVAFVDEPDFSADENSILSMILGLPNYPLIGGIHSKMYRLKSLQKYQISFKKDIINGEDMLFCLEGYLKTKQISFAKGKYYHYYINNLSATHRYSEKQISSDIKFHKELHQLLGSEKKYEKYKAFCLLNNFLVFFQRYSYQKEWSKKEIRKFTESPIFKEGITKYHPYISLFPKSKRMILYFIQKKRYNLVMSLYKVKHKLAKH